MHIKLENISKRYDSGWVLRDISIDIPSGTRLAILGPNGSGKSTLFQIISGYLSPTKGTVHFQHHSNTIERDKVYKHLAISTAYGELDEELTATELFKHYSVFRDIQIQDVNTFLEIADLTKTKNKQIKNYSSGMKQRLSLALAFNLRSDVLLLDEPTSFLDADKKEWYQERLALVGDEKTIIVATNDMKDTTGDFKKIVLS